jgi:hypothetical protein
MINRKRLPKNEKVTSDEDLARELNIIFRSTIYPDKATREKAIQRAKERIPVNLHPILLGTKTDTV